MIKSKQLAQAIFELSLGRSQTGEAKEKMPDLEVKLFDFIQKRNLQAQLPSILYHLKKIEELDREKHGIQIEVAHEIKPHTALEIKKFLKAEGLPEIIKVKKELIAGFRAKWNGVIYDRSIETGLKKLKEQIIS